MDIVYRKANVSDLPAIVAFVDYWLTGGGQANGIPGATHDYFVRTGQHKAYLAKYGVMLATFEGEIVGWAVKTGKGVLIHLLIAATFRGQGIGGAMLRRMDPEIVRSKFDQKSGDPAEFYRKQGYVRTSSERTGKKRNIELFHRACDVKVPIERSEKEKSELAKVTDKNTCGICVGRKRTIDTIAERVGLCSPTKR